MQNLTFENATAAEIPEILAMSDAGVAAGITPPKSDPADPAYLEAFNAITSDPNHRLISVRLNGELVGTFQLSFLPGLARKGMWRGMLENVHVRADQRGKGTGTAMTKWAVEECRKNGCGMVQLTSNKVRSKAHKFYTNLGFTATHEGFKLML